jgi:plastocyanin
LTRRHLFAWSATLSLGASLLTAPALSLAQEATPQAGMPPLPEGCAVYASGFYNPRGIELAADGTLYVAEAGDAGTEPFFAPSGDGTPAATEPLTVFGNSGQISKIAPDGTVSVVATGLASYSFGTEVVGPADVTVGADGTVYATVGGPGPLTAIVPPIETRDSVVAIDAAGTVSVVADIGANERSNNPDPNAIDSNLGGIVAGEDGLLYAVDTGGNTVYTVDPDTGALNVLAVIPGLPSPGGAANEARGGAAEIDPVPTNLVAAPDGGVLVGLLSGGPFIPGSAKVVHVAADGTVTDAATGLTMVAGVDIDADGTIYASQVSDDFLAQPPAAGSIQRIAPGGAPEAVISGLILPYDIALDDQGNIFVATMTTSSAGNPPMGMILKCALPASDTGEAPVVEGSPAAEGAAAATSITIDLVDIAFEPKDITIPANTDVTITLNAQGVAGHDFTIDELGIHSSNLTQGQTETITINAAPGTYTFYCSVPGHKEAGMIGTLTVQ